MIPFNKAPYTGNEEQYIREAILTAKLSGNGTFTQRCERWFLDHLGSEKALMVTSCTHALELAALLLEIKEGDEVIMPSYTFVSTANAFALRGAQIVFVDIDPQTMNISPKNIEAAITQKTKAVVPVHYAGVSCDMEGIMALANEHNIYVVEDAAQGVMASDKGGPVGRHGHMAAFSFHDTKNYTSGGEGGLLAINDPQFCERAEILREKGTNRSQFSQGLADKYTWIDIGSSYLASELQAAYLWGQLEQAKVILDDRMSSWSYYKDQLKLLEKKRIVQLPNIPAECQHNAHIFYLKLNSIKERNRAIKELKKRGIASAFHYVPLHSSPAGQRYGRFHGQDLYTTKESERLLRLPLWYGMGTDILRFIAEHTHSVLEKIAAPCP